MAISGKQRVHSLHPDNTSYGLHEVFYVASHTYSNESAFSDMYLLVGVGKCYADCLGGVQLAKDISNERTCNGAIPGTTRVSVVSTVELAPAAGVLTRRDY